MVRLSDLLVYKSLHGLGTDQSDVIWSPVLIFMTSSITYSCNVVTLTIDAGWSRSGVRRIFRCVINSYLDTG